MTLASPSALDKKSKAQLRSCEVSSFKEDVKVLVNTDDDDDYQTLGFPLELY